MYHLERETRKLVLLHPQPPGKAVESSQKNSWVGYALVKDNWPDPEAHSCGVIIQSKCMKQFTGGRWGSETTAIYGGVRCGPGLHGHAHVNMQGWASNSSRLAAIMQTWYDTTRHDSWLSVCFGSCSPPSWLQTSLSGGFWWGYELISWRIGVFFTSSHTN